MQIQKVQNTQNFGMALKIESERALASKSSEYLEKLSRIGRQIMHYNNSDIFIKNDGNLVIKPIGDKYGFSNLSVSEPPIFGIIDIDGVHEFPGCVAHYQIELPSQDDAQELYDLLSNKGLDELDKAKIFVDALERKFSSSNI